MLIRDVIQKMVKKAIEGAQKEGQLPPFVIPEIRIEHPAIAVHGDYTTTIALPLAKIIGKNSREVAEIINLQLTTYNLQLIDRVEIAGPGFINFFLSEKFLRAEVTRVKKMGERYGNATIGRKKKIHLEFISANPTGPLTLANGRGGFTGDVLGNVLTRAGYTVRREYYVNNAGNQVRTLGASVLAAVGEAPSDEKHYQGLYIKEWAIAHRNDISGKDVTVVGTQFAHDLLTTMIQPPIGRMGIRFDRWFLESSLYEKNSAAITAALVMLKKKKMVYEKDGATWFQTTKLGDDKDRVLMTSEGTPTYFLVDIAHYAVVLAEGWAQYINILGADHHGYVPRAKAAATVLGYKQFDAIVMQMVRLMDSGKEVRMSKRRGTYVTMDDLLDDVPVDVARFFFLMYTTTTHMDFDLALAKEQSRKNPVYSVQYAYTRLVNILKKTDGIMRTKVESPLAPAERALMVTLFRWPELLHDVAKSYEVHRLPAYALQLADILHAFYEQCRVMTDAGVDEKRRAIVETAAIVFRNLLQTMGVSHPEKM
ncbi:MAG: arginine--tRNA ligase [bacterium]|nr:arginine--tRNA ligase [bacterium]